MDIFRGFARNLETYKMLTRLKAPVEHDPNKKVGYSCVHTDDN